MKVTIIGSRVKKDIEKKEDYKSKIIYPSIAYSYGDDYEDTKEDTEKNPPADEGLSINTPENVCVDFGVPYEMISPNIYLRTINKNVFDIPFYYNVAHCVTADLTMKGAIAKRIETFAGAKRVIKNYLELFRYKTDDVIGTIYPCRNIINIIAKANDKEEIDYRRVKTCMDFLSTYCANNKIKYLAVPKLFSGGNHLDWEEVKKIMTASFEYNYSEINDTIPIMISICDPQQTKFK